jgi:hypothetical protein
VLNASFDLEGLPASPPPVLRKYDISDGKGNDAWEGATSDSPPSGGPGSFQQQKFASDGIADIISEDGNTHGTLSYAFCAPYQLFKFNVTEDIVSSLTVKWVGTGWDPVIYSTEASVYIYNSGRWETVGSVSGSGISDQLATFTRTFQTASGGYIDAAKNVYILAQGPYSWVCSMLETDYLELGVLGSFLSWPSELAVDEGHDGIPEFQQPGDFRYKKTIGCDILKAPLQKLIDDAGPGTEKVDVPFSFFSQTGGSLVVSGAVFDFDVTPSFSPVPSDMSCFDEDTEAPALIDLARYFQDDRDARLRYEMVMKPADNRIQCQIDPDGRHLSFWSTSKDWSGTREFGIRAQDSSNLSTTGFINITINPVNDQPVIVQITDQTAVEDAPFTLFVRASDVDDPSANLTFSDDCPLFEIGPSTGVISFMPANAQVGRYQVTVQASDTHGAIGNATFVLTVENVNDPPVLQVPEELEATEKKPFELELSATDEDAGDVVTYSVESDIDGLAADEISGKISFTFGEADVGEHQLELVATDSSGAEDRRYAILTVKNVNDAPVIEPGCELNATEGEEFDYTVAAFDPDIYDRITFSTDTDWLEIDSDTGRIRFIPSNADAGRHKFRVIVKDLAGLSAEARFLLNVTNVNDPPGDAKILSPRAFAVYTEGQDIMFNASAVDPDIGAVLVYTWLDGSQPLGRGPSFSARLAAGKHIVTLVVSDGALNVSASVEIEVRKVSAVRGLPLTLWQMVFVAALMTSGVAAGAVIIRRRKGNGKANHGMAPPAACGPNPSQGGNGTGAGLPAAPPNPQLNGPGGNGGAPTAPGPTMPKPGNGPVAMRPPDPVPGPVPPGPPVQMGWQPTAPPAPVWATAPPMYYPAPGYPGAELSAIQAAMRPHWNEGPPNPYAFAPWQATSVLSAYGDGPERAQVRPAQAPPPREVACEAEEAPDARGMEINEEDDLVSRDAMRTAVADAKQAIQAAKSAGQDPEECQRLLSEAIAASYRMDYPRARNLARKAESVARSFVERAPQQKN